MLRERITPSLPWADKTMSVLRTHQLKACEQRVLHLPLTSLFHESDDTRAELFWRSSHEGQEHPWSRHLHSIHEMRAQVMIRLPAEAALLSPQEHSLVERLLVFGGEASLLDWDELDAAESLVRRLWCTLVNSDDPAQTGNRRLLRLAGELAPALMMILASKAHEEIREHLLEVDQLICARLYMAGTMPMEQALSLLREKVLENTYADDSALALRYLRTTYDCTYDESGVMLLLHPGLAEPERLIACAAEPSALPLMSKADIDAASHGLLPCEQSAYQRLVGLIRQAVIPEVTEEEAAEDLLMLAKQGVSLDEMNDVLASLLVVLPTPDMLEGVRQLRSAAPRWGSMHTGVMQ